MTRGYAIAALAVIAMRTYRVTLIMKRLTITAINAAVRVALFVRNK